jgi:hypothetical protein
MPVPVFIAQLARGRAPVVVPRFAGRADAIFAGRAVPPPFPAAAAAELREIVARAEARAGL